MLRVNSYKYKIIGSAFYLTQAVWGHFICGVYRSTGVEDIRRPGNFMTLNLKPLFSISYGAIPVLLNFTRSFAHYWHFKCLSDVFLEHTNRRRRKSEALNHNIYKIETAHTLKNLGFCITYKKIEYVKTIWNIYSVNQKLQVVQSELFIIVIYQ